MNRRLSRSEENLIDVDYENVQRESLLRSSVTSNEQQFHEANSSQFSNLLSSFLPMRQRDTTVNQNNARSTFPSQAAPIMNGNADVQRVSPELLYQVHVLQQKRTRILNVAKIISKKFEPNSGETYNSLKLTMNRLHSLQTDFDKIQEDIIELNLQLPSQDDEIPTLEIQTEFEMLVLAAHSFFGETEATAQSRASPVNHPVPSSGITNIRLAPIELPSFSGKFSEWSNFYNLFKVSIHETDLPDLEKFQRLKTKLEGDAGHIIANLALTPENYNSAWNLVVKYYQNDRRHTMFHFNGLIELPELGPSNLPTFLAQLREHMYALDALKFKKEGYSPLLTVMILKKFNNYHKRRFEDTRMKDKTTMPSIDEIIYYLESEVSRFFDNESRFRTAPKCQKKPTNLPFNALHSEVSSSNASNFSARSKNHNQEGKKSSSPFQQGKFEQRNVSIGSKSNSSSTTSSNNNCVLCDSNQHQIYHCRKYYDMTPQARREFVVSKKLCFNCLKSHSTNSCMSYRVCNVKDCNQKHHSSLHQSMITAMPIQMSFPSPNQSSVINYSSNEEINGTINPITSLVSKIQNQDDTRATLLPTVQVLLTANNGFKIMVRAILDSAADKCFLTSSCQQLLNLRSNSPMSVAAGLSGKTVRTLGSIEVNIVNPKNGELLIPNHEIMIVEKITGSLPAIEVNENIKDYVKHLSLADERFNSTAPVDLLLGVDVYGYLVKGKPIQLGPTLPFILNTVFGYAIMGTSPSNPLPFCVPITNPQPDINVFLTTMSLQNQVEKFWRQEEADPPQIKLSPEERYAEEFYEKTTIQLSNQKYQVRLPFRPNAPPLGETLSIAEKRFYQLESKFRSDPKLKEMYVNFMSDYLKNGHMKQVPLPSSDVQHFFLPHHGVIKEQSSSTKLRTVFNASQKSSNGRSLNDILLPGPPLQLSIPEVLLNFRQYKITISGDIKQMYLQILLHPDDHRYQLILWRFNPDEPIQVYALTTVTFGINSSPYIALKTIQKLARDYGHLYPRAAKVLLNEIYVDDALCGEDTPEAAKSLLQELNALLALGGFFMRKWTSNCPDIFSDLPKEHLEKPIFDDFNNEVYNMLGLKWLAEKDAFSYSIKIPALPTTKRGILALTASIFDPNGFLSPTIFKAKVFLQELWVLNVDWDTHLPPSILEKWEKFMQQLPSLALIEIPRHINVGGKPVQICAFCDASESGYASVVYIRFSNEETCVTQSSSSFKVMLLFSKSRVAPLKKVSIPRLELCAATLLTKLLKTFLPRLASNYNIENIYAWSDSTVTLTWIQTPAYRLKTFVSNRVVKIQEMRENIIWQHCKSADNAADILSRGQFPTELVNNRQWWNGPLWLSKPIDEWPVSTSVPLKVVPELKIVTSALVVAEKTFSLPSLSSCKRTIRSTAWLLKFVEKIKNSILIPKEERNKKKKIPNSSEIREMIRGNNFTLSEMEEAEMKVLIGIQNEYFEEEIKILKKNEKIRKENEGKKEEEKVKEKRCIRPIQRLTPFFDEKGLLRVGGRIRHAIVPAFAKNQIILPSQSPLIRSLVNEHHLLYLHAPTQFLQAQLAQRYWILAGKRVIKSVINKCDICFRANPKNEAPLMGNLPPARVQPNPPFSHVGIDFTGAFKIKIHMARFARIIPIYVCVYVCLSTKAVHLETVHDMTTPAFLASLLRFTSRRGSPSDVYCDQGSNFVGAANYFEKLLNSENEELINFANDRKIKFHFNAPYNPEAGGLWEAAVKSLKYHLTRTIGLRTLTLEEFQTVIIRIEAILNSRPLVPLSSDPNDLQPLTPGHFLIGRSITAFPEENLGPNNIHHLRRWKMVQAITQQIWKNWHLYYLHTLQARNKWSEVSKSLQVGTLVLLHDPQAPPLAWKLGRIIETFPGEDGHVRVADVKTTSGIFRRPAIKLYPLPSSDI